MEPKLRTSTSARPGLLPWTLAVAAGGLLACSGAASAGEVYYQVTYDTGQVADVSSVPPGREGIRGVLRIVLPDAPGEGMVLSTHPPNIVKVPAQATRQELSWDGRAWVAPMPARQPARRAAQVQSEQLEEIKRLLHSQRRRLERTRQLPPERAQLRRIEMLDESVRQLDALLAALNPPATAPTSASAPDPLLGLPATGRLAPLDAPFDNPVVGSSQPVDRTAVPDHRVQVWPLPASQGPRTVNVAMAHPEAGWNGAFYYVAYGDADDDGVPDTLIARSDLAAADRPGGWTQWSFDTDQTVVFVGNAWAAEQPSAYLAPAPADQGVMPGEPQGAWIGPREVYVSGIFGSPPCRRLGRDGHGSVYLPFITNLRVRIIDQNPDQPSEAQGVKIIRLP